MSGRFILWGLVLFVVIRPSFAEEPNDCHDPAAALEWEALVQKSPKDLALQRLHALRLGICEKIEKGSLTLEQGTALFEQEREAVVNQRFEENRSKQKKRAF